MPNILKEAKVPNFDYETPWKKNLNFYESLNGKLNILIFMRFYGCRICQLDITKLINNYDEFTQLDVQIKVVLQTEPEIIRANDKEKSIPFDIICDPNHELYELYEVSARPADHQHSEETLAILNAKLEEASSRGLQKIANNDKQIPTQLPATFIINSDGTLLYSHYGVHEADVPNPETLIELVKKYK